MIRHATLDDLRTVVGMGLDHYAAIQGRRFPPIEEAMYGIRDFCERCIVDPDHYCAVAVDDETGDVVGMMTGVIAPGMLYVPDYLVAHEVSTWVREDAREGGYGSALVEYFYGWAEHHPSAPRMALVGVYQHLAPKQVGRMYRRCGFALEAQTFSRRIKPCRPS